VYAIGLRNPWRFSFDRLTGDLSIGDVGQDRVEEIDFSPVSAGLGRGANYGWNLIEGNLAYPGGGPPTGFPPGYVGPVITRTHTGDGWHSITGGYVMRDAALPELMGRYVYGDFAKGDLWSTTLTPGAAVGDAPLGLHVDQLDSFGEDGCGRLYAVSLAGPVYRLATTGACAGPAPVPFAPLAVAPAPSPTTTPVPVVAPTVVDRRAPLIKLSTAKRQRALRRGYISVSAACDEQCRLTATGKLNLSGPTPKRAKAVSALKVKPVKRSLAANARVALKLPIPAKTRISLRRSVAHGRAAFATVTILATDLAGNQRSTTVRVRLLR
jgi:hypothetical protein